MVWEGQALGLLFFLSSRCTTCMNQKRMQKMAQSIYDRMTPAPPALFYFPISAYYCISQCVRVSLRQKQREKVCVWVMRRWGKLLSSHLLSLYLYSLRVLVCVVCVFESCQAVSDSVANHLSASLGSSAGAFQTDLPPAHPLSSSLAESTHIFLP